MEAPPACPTVYQHNKDTTSSKAHPIIENVTLLWVILASQTSKLILTSLRGGTFYLGWKNYLMKRLSA